MNKKSFSYFFLDVLNVQSIYSTLEIVNSAPSNVVKIGLFSTKETIISGTGIITQHYKNITTLSYRY